MGSHVYKADLDGLYNSATATHQLKGSGNELEKNVLDAGYKGYINPEQGTIVMLNQDVPVKYQGQSSDHKVVQRSIQRIIPRVMTRVEGGDMVRRPDNREMMDIVQNRNAISQAAPSFRLEYGEARVKSDQAAAADRVLADAGSNFQFGEVQHSMRDDDEITPEMARGRRVSYPVEIQDTKQVATVTVDAGNAIDDYNERTDQMNKLLGCLLK